MNITRITSHQFPSVQEVTDSAKKTGDILVNTDILTRIYYIGYSIVGVAPALSDIVDQINILANLQNLYTFSKRAYALFKPHILNIYNETKNETETSGEPVSWQKTAIKVCYSVNRTIKSIRFLDHIKAIKLNEFCKDLDTATTLGVFTYVPIILLKDFFLSLGCALEAKEKNEEHTKINHKISLLNLREIADNLAPDHIKDANATLPKEDIEGSVRDLEILRRDVELTIADDVSSIAMTILPYIGVIFSIAALGTTAPMYLLLAFFSGSVGIAQLALNTYYKANLERVA